MTKVSVGWLLASLIMTFGPLLAAAPSFAWFATPSGAGAALIALGGVLGAAFGVTPTAPVGVGGRRVGD